MHTLFYLLKLFVLSSAFEEVLHKCSAFLLQDAACYSCFWMENVGCELMEAPLFIACSIYCLLYTSEALPLRIGCSLSDICLREHLPQLLLPAFQHGQ